MIALFGDYITDKYIYGDINRISPESPIPVFLEKSTEIRDGGASNVYNNLVSLGNKVSFFYSKNSTKVRYVNNNHIMFRSDIETYIPYYGKIEFNLNNIKYCILSDYNKGFLHRSQEIIDYCKSKNCIVIVDPKKHLSHYINADIVKLNEKELREYTDNLSYKEVRETYNIKSLVITLGSKGVYISSDQFEGLIEADKHQVSDVTGAGDVFIASMTHYLNKGLSLYDSCLKATRLASISVTKFGTYVLTEEDIKKTKVVFTNGCFDIIHKGHIDYLKKSKDLGYKLIVGLNSDSSVKRLKGDSRPINNQEDRKTVLESLRFIDEVIIFDEDTPYQLIQKIKPDIITKGGDYNIDNVVGNDLAEVIIIPFLNGYSTTNILEKK